MKLYPNSWIGFDLDRTLAEYHEWEGITKIGKPIPAMVKTLHYWLAQGIPCKIFTARVAPVKGREHQLPDIHKAIREWCLEHIGQELEITATKDMSMLFLYDDRAVQVEPNTGRIIGKEFKL